MKLEIELTEDLRQSIMRRERLMATMDASKTRLLTGLIEAENQQIAREVARVYERTKQV